MSVEVMSGGGSANLQSKSILPSSLPYTASPDSGYDGFSSLTVQKPSLLLPENIKSGVSLFGVSGSYSADDVICVKATREYGTAADVVGVFDFEKSISDYSSYNLVSFYVTYSGRDAIVGSIVTNMSFNAYTSIFGNTGVVPARGSTQFVTRDVYLSAANSNIAGTYVQIGASGGQICIVIESANNVVWGQTGSYTMWAWFAKNAKLIN